MTYGTIVVCGGGCYGGYYVRQLARARAGGAITFSRIVVVDREPQCTVARLADAIARHDAAGIAAHGWALQKADQAAHEAVAEPAYHGLPVEVVVSDWDTFFAGWFARLVDAHDLAAHDAVVPSPLMP
ncbi:MAG TPA: hypothetical protein VE861_10160, partial [Gemmatimonadaceae bacterium]|nr:hypothetical protein [Gemmatimonadaceae bacterium]